MLAFLAMQRDGQADRERLCGLLWSDRGDEQARASLRQSLAELRRTFGTTENILTTSRVKIGLAIDQISVDVRCLESKLKSEVTEGVLAAIELWRGRLLEEITPPDGEFNSWLTIERTRLEHDIVHASYTALRSAVRLECDPDIRRLCDFLILLEASDETAHEAMIKLLLKRGDRVGALQQFENYRQALRRDFELEPSASLRQLVEGTRRSKSSHVPIAGGRSVRRLPSVALILHNVDDVQEPNQEFCSLVFEEVIQTLGRSRSLIVILPPGNERCVDTEYTLTLKARSVGMKSAILLRLENSLESRLIIANAIERTGGGFDSEALQIARKITGVEQAILSDYRDRSQGRVDPYALWLTADRLTDSFEFDALTSATALFQRSSELDPDFSRPIAGLASVRLCLPMVNPSDALTKESFYDALAFAKTAVSIDPWDARSRVVLGWAYYRTGRFSEGEAEFRRAVELDPNSPAVLISASEGLAHTGDIYAVDKYGLRAFSIHPAAPDYFHLYSLQANASLGKFEAAIKHSLAVSSPLIPEPLAWQAFSFAMLGRRREAQRSTQAFLNSVRQRWTGHAAYSPDLALAWLERMLCISHGTRREVFVECLGNLIADSSDSDPSNPTYIPL
jgi:DNA-binding SARP family transcriptional activator